MYVYLLFGFGLEKPKNPQFQLTVHNTQNYKSRHLDKYFVHTVRPRGTTQYVLSTQLQLQL